MQPHHLQQHTRYLETLLGDLMRNLGGAWGFREVSLDRSELPAGLLGVSTAYGLMPDGTPLVVDAEHSGPTPIDISKCERGEVIYLAVAPRTGDLQGQSVADSEGAEADVRYLAHTADVIDNAAALAEGEAALANGRRRPSAVPVRVGRLRSWLTRGDAIPDNRPSLAVARVGPRGADGSVRLDEDFVPPITMVNASTVLDFWLRELVTLAKARAVQLERRLGDVAVGIDSSLDLHWLIAVNRYEPALRGLTATKAHPAEAYRLLLQMRGELATLGASPPRLAEDGVTYEHGNPGPAFMAVIEELREVLTAPLSDRPIELPGTKVEEKQTWLFPIKDRAVLEDVDLVLAATASVDELSLAHLPEQMIVGPVEEIDSRTSVLEMELARVKPRGVPTLNRWTYYLLRAEGRAWDALRKDSAAIAFFVDRLQQDFPELRLRFWAVPRR